MLRRFDPEGAERLFRRYLRTREPAALSGVFEAIAPELLRVARSLLDSPAQAEDAVQTTFLAVIQRPERFDVRQRLVPWLMGILANVVREARTDARRRPDPERLVAVTTAPTDPAAVAIAEERRRRVRGAMMELTPGHREILHLHFDLGLSVREISEHLRRRPSSVRGRIARAMDALRRVLPRGLPVLAAVDGAAAAAEGRVALAIARRVATQMAASPGAGVPTTTAAAAATPARRAPLGRRAIGGTAVGLATLAVWTIFAAFARNDSGARRPNHLATATPAASPLLSTPRGTPEPMPPAATRRPVPTDTGELLVRVRDAEGRPTPGIGVALATRPREQQPTDAAGEVVFASLSPGPVRVLVDRLPLAVDATVAAGSRTLARAEIGGPQVQISVRNPAGEPVPGARVLGVSVFDGLERPFGATDAHGRLDLARVTLGFDWIAEAPGWFSPRPGAARGLGRARHPVAIEVRPWSGRLHGHLRDARGEPVMHGLLALAATAGANDKNRTPLLVRAAADGRFATSCAPPGSAWFVAVDPTAPSRGIAFGRRALTPDATSSWQLRLAGATLAGRVTDTAGQPVPGASVTWEIAAPHPPELDRWLRRSSITGPDGRYQLDALPGGAGRARITRGAAAVATRIELGADATEWSPRIDLASTLRLRLVDAEGRPLPRCRLRIWRTPREPLSREVTDEAGRAEIVGLPDHALLITGYPARSGPHFLPPLVARVRPGPNEIELQLEEQAPNSCSVHFRALYPSGLPATAAELALQRVGHPAFWTLHQNAAYERQRSDLFQPGRYRLRLRAGPRHVPRFLGPRQLAPHEVWDLGDVVFPATGAVVLAVEAPAAGGEPVVEWCVERPDGRLWPLPGGAEPHHLLPGTHTVWMNGPTVLPQRLRVAVREGETARPGAVIQPASPTELVVRVPHAGPRTLHGDLTVRRSDGAIVLRRAFRADLSGAATELSLTQGLPPGVFECRIRADDAFERAGLVGEARVSVGPNLAPGLVVLH
ncbi:MAG: sigma-70 family RNA polymerase sigma factor [Planctomycetota bacterium]